MTNATTGDLDKILRRVQALIAKAESTDFPEEADSFRAKADALMAQYRIEESVLAAAGPVGGFLPIWKNLLVCQFHSQFRDSYRQVASWVLSHVGGQGVFRYVDMEVDGVTARWVVLEAVGYESDLRYAEMLLTSCTLAFGERMEPKVDPELSEQGNAYRMRKAGMELARIALLLRGPEANTKSNRRALRMKVLAECEARGEDPNEILGAGNNMKTYRASYGEGFSNEIYHRLYRMRYEAGDQSQALVLAGRADAIKEAFYERYEWARPKPVSGSIGTGWDTCAKCAKAKSGHCRDHPAGRAPKAQSVNYRARQAGASAAASVDLGNTKRLS